MGDHFLILVSFYDYGDSNRCFRGKFRYREKFIVIPTLNTCIKFSTRVIPTFIKFGTYMKQGKKAIFSWEFFD